jgi:predicted nucleic acid-binding protein
VTIYLDTSALVKLYVAESGGDAVRRAVAAAREAATSLLAYAEIRAAFARKCRMGEMSGHELNAIKRELTEDWQHFNQLPVEYETVRIAADLAERFGLRGYDSVHLATADRLYREIRSPVLFACFDSALNTAASSLGLSLLPR